MDSSLQFLFDLESGMKIHHLKILYTYWMLYGLMKEYNCWRNSLLYSDTTYTNYSRFDLRIENLANSIMYRPHHLHKCINFHNYKLSGKAIIKCGTKLDWQVFSIFIYRRKSFLGIGYGQALIYYDKSLFDCHRFSNNGKDIFCPKCNFAFLCIGFI